MKRRVTFITAPGQDIPNNALRLTQNSLEVKNFHAIREDRFTFGFDELPQLIQDVLKQTHELYVRFDSGKDFNDRWDGPFPSRLPLGIHVFAVPLGDTKMENLCGFISKYSDAVCSSIEESFIGSKRVKQFYAPDPNLLPKLLQPLSNKICGPGKRACRDKILALNTASSLDLKYDAISQIFEVNALWASYHAGNAKDKSWTILIKPDSQTSRVEVGVLSEGLNGEPEDISLDGVLAVIGDDANFKSTRFSFPSRHHSHKNIYKASFIDPPGLHPKLKLEIAPIPAPPAEECTLDAYFTIPQPFFVDPYQLQDEDLLKANGIKKIRVIEGETDLEAPTWAVKKWGAVVLAELDVWPYFKNRANGEQPIEATLPLHLRYMPTNPERTNQTASLPWPSLFWACKSDEWSKMSTNPFDRRMLGYEDYFPEQTYFYHFTPKLLNATHSQSNIDVPVLSSEYAQAIYWGTLAVVLVGFTWVFGTIVVNLFSPSSKIIDESKKKEE